MAPPKSRASMVALLVAMGAFAPLACSVEDDGLRRELERMRPASSAGRPPVILAGTDDGGTTSSAPPAPTAPIDTPSVVDAAADVVSDVVAIAEPPPAGDGGASLKALGQTCAAAAECASGFCADRVCCASTCRGICEFCAAESTRGQCTPVMGATRGGRPSCMGLGMGVGLTPDCAGFCDGQEGARCRYPGPETECAPALCNGDSAQTQGTCSGTGRCNRRLQVECMGNGCSGPICANGCSPANPCPGNRYCAGGRCFNRQLSGVACAHGYQCASGFCVDGVCCQSNTCGVCEACTAPGGVCTRLTSGADVDTCTDGRACTPDGTCK